MKFKILTLFSFLSFAGFSQEYYNLEHIVTNDFGFDSMPAVKLNINKVDKNMAIAEWQKALKKYDKEEILVDETSVTVKKIVIPEITKNPFNIYTHFASTKTGVEIIIAYRDSSMSVNIQNHKNGVSLEKELTLFIESIYVKQLNVEIKSANQHLSNLEKSAKKVQKDIDKLNKTIINLQIDIDNYTKEIEVNNGAFEDVLKVINDKKTELAGLSSKDESYKGVKKEVDQLEKRKNNVDKDIRNFTTKIYESERKIEDSEAELKVLEEVLINEEEKVTAQRKKVIDLEDLVYEIDKG